MDCRNFRKQHLAFLDDTLPGIETAAMHKHVQSCSACARQDAMIRRSLLLVRNLPTAQCSEGFSERLKARLAGETVGQNALDSERPFRGPSTSTFIGVACAVLAIGAISIAIADGSPSFGPADPRLPSVVVAPGEPSRIVDTILTAPAYVASMSTGIPMWPALLLAEEGSLRFASVELKPVSLHDTQEQ
jgi:putative zinc finger protein